ncbi:starch synthase (maltosyl-transferring) [Bosea sp. OAE506]
MASSPQDSRKTWRNPRIYYLHPRLAGAPSDWKHHVGNARDLGFDHVLLAWPFSEGRDLFATTDLDRIAGSPTDDVLGSLRECCRRAGMTLWMDLALGHAEADGALVAQLPGCWSEPHRAGLDPRTDLRRPAVKAAFDQPETRQRLLAFWGEQVERWTHLGIEGLRCHDGLSVPRDVWRDLLAPIRQSHPDVLIWGWMPEATAAERAASAEIFDAVSAPIATGRGVAALVEDHHNLGEGPFLVGCPEDPFSARRPAAAPVGPQRMRQAAVMASALLADGWMMPMGFELGLETLFIHAQTEDLQQRASSDGAMAQAVRAANEGAAALPVGTERSLRLLSSPAASSVVLRQAGDAACLALLNEDPVNAAALDLRASAAGLGMGPAGDGRIELPPAWGVVIGLEETSPIRGTSADAPQDREELAATRIAIEAVSPAVEGGCFAVKRSAGEPVLVTADIFSDGHEVLAADLLWRAEDETGWSRTPMALRTNDIWEGEFPLLRVGRHLFAIEAWWSEFGTFRRDLAKKRDAGLDIALEIREGRIILERFAKAAAPVDRGVIEAHLGRLGASQAENAAILLSDALDGAMTRADPRPHATGADRIYPVDADREAAAFSSWYELFPRSITDGPARHGTFRDVLGRLPAVKAMGFDVLYFPPIHPIGKTNRKGRNNTLTPSADDPGSPYAIGSHDGGHDAIHPELGSREDFRALVRAAADHGLEIALDFAIQCSPDHPWLEQHPGWFQWRPDGSMRYAENPPKKYQDIVNVDFYTGDAIPGLWVALRDVVQGWVDEGVRIFRVDNPHTKPFPFWEWLIADIRSRDPGVLFLAEAFTRPKVMYRLGKVGFSQSYTYFTWRNTKAELTEYLSELNEAPARDIFRPHFFVNTPDINPVFLQRSGRPGFLIRAALAATLSGLWGVYSGFELCEAAAIPGKEEYLDSEKYEIKPRDWQAPGNIVAEITRLNQIRRSLPALQSHLGLTFYNASDDNILYFGKRASADGDIVLVAVNLDPFNAHEAGIEVPLWEFGLPDDGSIAVEDLMRGHRFRWHGKSQSIRLDPGELPFSIWRLSAPTGSL